MPHIFSISELNQALKEVLEGEFPLVWVRGQVGDLSRPGSGHIYFTLKDEQASLQIVWFKSNQAGHQGQAAPQQLQTGLEVLCAGRITVYPPRGTYQLIAEQVQPFGAGQLHLQFEALKKKLAALGWFAPENKKSLPGRIQRVAVITAPFGAALQDFLRLSQDRGWPGEIRIYPSLVQGQGAEDNLVSAVQEAALEGWAQVLVLIRGGGSLEDLWCFNSEQLAQNLYELELPVLTGIGHETDVTIADLVADVRAATPSHAAQLLWPERNQLLQQLDELQGQLVSSCHRLYSFKLQQLQELQRALHWLSPWQNLQRHLALLQEQSHALVSRSQRLVQHKKRLLRDLAFRLNRTFSFKEWRYRMSSLQELQHRLLTAADRHVQNWENKYQEVNIRLARHNPLLPLEQGYSLVRVAKDHSLLRRAQQVQPGDLLLISTREDVLQARVVASDSAQSDSACNASQRLPGPQDLPEA